MNQHLTEEDFDNLLIDIRSEPRVLAHLEACEECGREVAYLRDGMKAFNELGGNWASSNAVTSVQTPMRWAKLVGSRPEIALRWGGALVAATILAFVVSRGTHLNAPSVVQPAVGSSLAQIAQDNQWLRAMDKDLQSGPQGLVISSAATPRVGHAIDRNISE